MSSENGQWHGEIHQPKRTQYLTHVPLPLYSRFPAELISILLLASLFTLVATILQCLCSEGPYLSAKLSCIYVCYMSITLYIVFSMICGCTVTTVGHGMYYLWKQGHTCIYYTYDKCTDMFCFVRTLCSKWFGYVSSGKWLLMFWTVTGPPPSGSNGFVWPLDPEAEGTVIPQNGQNVNPNDCA
jgi:hypothetical protein